MGLLKYKCRDGAILGFVDVRNQDPKTAVEQMNFRVDRQGLIVTQKQREKLIEEKFNHTRIINTDDTIQMSDVACWDTDVGILLLVTEDEIQKAHLKRVGVV